jgi:hypothetical protein
VVFQWTRRDPGKILGESIGQAAGGLTGTFARNKLLQAGVRDIQDEMRKTGQRTGVDLYNMLNERIGHLPGGQERIQQLLPVLEKSAQQMPLPDTRNERTPVAPGTPQEVSPQQANEITQTRQQLADQETQPAGTTNNPLLEEYTKVQSTPGELIKGEFNAQNLIDNPELIDTLERKGLEDYYNTEPVMNPQEFQSKVDTYIEAGKTPEQARERVNQDYQQSLEKWRQNKRAYEASEQRIGDARSLFETGLGKDFKTINPALDQAATRLIQWESLKSKPSSPRVIADKAIKEITNYKKNLEKINQIGAIGIGDLVSSRAYKQKYDGVKTLADRAQKLGIQEQAYNDVIKDNLISPADASALIFPPPKEVIDIIKKIPNIGYTAQEVDLSHPLEGLKVPQKKIDQALDLASEALLVAGDKAGLTGIRGLLGDKDIGFDRELFNRALDLAEEKGLNLSERQQREREDIASRPIYNSIADIYNGRKVPVLDVIINYLKGYKQ